MDWVLISEALPDDMQEVLLFDQVTNRTIGYYHNETDCFIRESDGLRLQNVISWMPLPEAPAISLASLVAEYRSCSLLSNENRLAFKLNENELQCAFTIKTCF